jgi:hypothetical protein
MRLVSRIITVTLRFISYEEDSSEVQFPSFPKMQATVPR